MPRLAACLFALAAATSGCGFGVADDTGKAIPATYWKWACPDGGAPAPDAGCQTDASVSHVFSSPSS